MAKKGQDTPQYLVALTMITLIALVVIGLIGKLSYASTASESNTNIGAETNLDKSVGSSDHERTNTQLQGGDKVQYLEYEYN